MNKQISSLKLDIEMTAAMMEITANRHYLESLLTDDSLQEIVKCCIGYALADMIRGERDLSDRMMIN